jgi:hypothetical protein
MLTKIECGMCGNFIHQGDVFCFECAELKMEQWKRYRLALEKFADENNWLIGFRTDTGVLCSPDWMGEGDPIEIARNALQTK